MVTLRHFYGDTFIKFYDDTFGPFHGDTFRTFYGDTIRLFYGDTFRPLCRTQITWDEFLQFSNPLQNIKNVIYFDILHEQFSVTIVMLWEQSLWYKVLKLMLDTTPGIFFNHECVINEKLCEVWIYFVFTLTHCTGILFAGIKCLEFLTEFVNNNDEGDNFVEF